MEITTLLYWITGVLAASLLGWLAYALLLIIERIADKCPRIKEFINKNA